VTSNQFFIKKIPEGQERFFLSGDEHYHLSRVARIKAGENIWLSDGHRRRLLARVEEITRERTWLRPLRVIDEVLKTELTVAVGLTKPATFEFLIQKATELGVARIQPLLTKRAMLISSDKLENKWERWNKIAREALKQSKGAVLPEILKPVSLPEALAQFSAERKFFLDEHSTLYFRDILKEKSPATVCLVVGPEGGWDEEEKKMLQKNGYEGLSLGGRILRTETAVIAALVLISHYWNW